MLPEYRGNSLGNLIVQRLESIAKANEIDVVFLYPHQYLEPFYSKMGYKKVSDSEFMIGPHQLIKMTKSLTALAQT